MSRTGKSQKAMSLTAGGHENNPKPFNFAINYVDLYPGKSVDFELIRHTLGIDMLNLTHSQIPLLTLH